MDRFLMKYLNNKYALTFIKVSKSGTWLSMAHSTPLVFRLGNKLAHDLA